MPLAGKSSLNRLDLAAARRRDQKARTIVVDSERLDQRHLQGEPPLHRDFAARRDPTDPLSLRAPLLRAGEAENPVKEHQLHLFSVPCSSHLFGGNTLRLYLSTFAIILFRALREALRETRLPVASANRIRFRLPPRRSDPVYPFPRFPQPHLPPSHGPYEKPGLTEG